MKTKVALVIPYFNSRGELPDYYDLWAASAGKNPNFDFLIFSDLNFPVNQYPNVKKIFISFSEFQQIIENKLPMKIVLDTPYKLCDYKVTYGYVLSDYLSGYDFWGFCDMDLIFGNIENFINDELLSKFDKILYSGHFSLMRNNDHMNQMFFQKFKNVIDYEIAFSVSHCCHFDENGPSAYSNEYDPTVKFYFKWIFWDSDFRSYQFIHRNNEAVFIWDNGTLTEFWNSGKESQEMMYIHLQKRKMQRDFSGIRENFAIFRDRFIDADTSDVARLLQEKVNLEDKKQFEKRISQKLRKNKLDRLKQGWIKVKLYSMIHHIRIQKDLKSSEV